MNIIYLRDRNLAEKLPALTFGELRKMLPEIGDGERVPRPETLVKDLRDRFLEAAEEDFSVRIYSNGICLYQEGNGISAYAVSQCATLVFPSVSAEYEAEIQTDDMQWFPPLIVMGQERVSHNLDSGEEYRVLRFEAGIPAELTPYTPDFVVETSPEEEYENYRRKLRNLHDELRRVTRCMTERQKEVFFLRYGQGLKLEEIAVRLGIRRSSVFDTLRGADRKVNRYLFR